MAMKETSPGVWNSDDGKSLQISALVIEGTMIGIGKSTLIYDTIRPLCQAKGLYVTTMDDCLDYWTPPLLDTEKCYKESDMTSFYNSPYCPSMDSVSNQVIKESILLSFTHGRVKSHVEYLVKTHESEMEPGEVRHLVFLFSRHLPRSALCFGFKHIAATTGGENSLSSLAYIKHMESVFEHACQVIYGYFERITIIDVESALEFDALVALANERFRQRGRRTELSFFPDEHSLYRFFKRGHEKFQNRFFVPSKIKDKFKSKVVDGVFVQKHQVLQQQKWTVVTGEGHGHDQKDMNKVVDVGLSQIDMLRA